MCVCVGGGGGGGGGEDGAQGEMKDELVSNHHYMTHLFCLRSLGRCSPYRLLRGASRWLAIREVTSL